MEKIEDVNQYLDSLKGPIKELITDLVNYMREHHSDLEEVISFQMPTYKLGSGKERNYISFSYGKNHVSFHTMDFEYIASLKSRLKNAGKGKGCVHIALDDTKEKEIIFQAIEDVIRRRVFSRYGGHQS